MDRISSGNLDLDLILGGGFPLNSLSVIAGSPGAGKTILAQQFIYANARADAPALYLTTLSEPASKMLRYLQEFSFFDEGKLLDAPAAVVYRDIAEMVRAEDFQFKALPGVLATLLDEYRPSFLVLDSFKALRDLGGSGPELRRPLFDLAGALAARACTTLLVGEYTEQEVEELPEFAIADGIVQLVNKTYGTRDERYLRVRKLRGSDYRAGEHAFRITDRGLSIFPRLLTPALPATHVTPTDLISTGVSGLDQMFCGGVRRGSSTLVSGAPGTGKTLLGLHFLFAGMAVGEQGLLVSFQENPSLLRHLITGLGFDVKELDEGGRLTALYVSPVEMNIDDVVQRITAALAANPIQRVVIDSLGDLEMASADPQRFRSYIYSLMQLLAVRGVTTYATNVAAVDQSYTSFTQSGASYISDNVIALRYFVDNDTSPDQVIRRTVSIVKCRGGTHDSHIRRMAIGARGVEVIHPTST